MSNALANVYSFGNKLRNNLKALLTDPVNHLASQANIWAADMNRALDSPATAYRRAGGVMADDPSTVAAANREQERMTAALMGTAPGFVGMTAWHGSPHKFDRFDSSKIGTGEGAQAYGHGLYLAENQGVADSYRRTLTAGVPDVYVNGRRLSGGALNTAANQLAETKDVITRDDLRRHLTDRLADAIDSTSPYAAAHAKELREALKKLQGAKEVRVDFDGAGGALYKVDLPDEMVARMLDWDKPLSQQSPEVMAALQNSGVLESAIKQGGFYPQDVTSGLMEGRHIFPAKRSPKGPEEALRAAGIPGIRYLDEGSRNTALLPHFDVVRKSDGATVMQVIEGGEKRPDIAKLTASGEFELRGPVDKRTRNFVIFPGEENALRILERNGMTLADMAGQSGKIDSRLLAALGLGSAAAVAGNSLLNSGKKKMEDAKKARQQAIEKAEEK
jgi:hypothetical protein